MAPLDAILGLFALALLLVGMSGVGLVVHLVTRERRTPVVRATDALKPFEPRGGRQRFSVRLFEVAALASTWVLTLGVLGLWVSGSGGMSPRAVLFASVFGGSLVVATWWAWRRGVLRGPVRAEEPELRLLRRRRRGLG